MPAPQNKTGLRLFSYMDIPNCKEGWISTEDFLPEDFDLVMLKDQNNRISKGWMNGNSWDGSKITKRQVIKFWKRDFEYRNSP